MRAFRKESPWFYDTESLKIVITGTRLAEKNAEGITVKLTEPGEGGSISEIFQREYLDGTGNEG